MTEPQPERLFYESGASWLWVLSGPISALIMLGIQVWSGAGVQWAVPVAFLVLVTLFVWMQVAAARIHTSVELTPTTLREGTQVIGVDEIVRIYPEPPDSAARPWKSPSPARNALANRAMRQAGIDPAEVEAQAKAEATPQPGTSEAEVLKWQSARALGELTGVPRGRTGIGIKLADGRTTQAWARNHRGLRTALTALLEERG